MVVGVDTGSIPCKGKPANTRYDPAKGCGKVLTPTLIPRIFPIQRVGSIQNRIATHSKRAQVKEADAQNLNLRACAAFRAGAVEWWASRCTRRQS